MESLLAEHLGYLSDSVRIDQFRQAIHAAVKPGDRVADLGCGSGILGLLALQAGAAHVYAVDHGPMLEVARETLARAGFRDRASFIHGRSQQIDLPERVDVLLCDHVGWFGFDYGILHLVQDARQRFLKPGGIVIPAHITMHVAAIESDRCHALAQAWRGDRVPVEFHWLAEQGVNGQHGVRLERSELLSAPAELGSCDLREDAPAFVSWAAPLVAERDGVVHGLGGWCACELRDGIGMTNSPLATTPIDRLQVFLPLAEPVSVKSGERMTVTLGARHEAALMAWSLEVASTGRRVSQSNWQRVTLSAEKLAMSNPASVPVPTHEALARGLVLGYCDGRRTRREVEHAVLEAHPTLFPSAAEIARFVSHVLDAHTTVEGLLRTGGGREKA